MQTTCCPERQRQPDGRYVIKNAPRCSQNASTNRPANADRHAEGETKDAKQVTSRGRGREDRDRGRQLRNSIAPSSGVDLSGVGLSGAGRAVPHSDADRMRKDWRATAMSILRFPRNDDESRTVQERSRWVKRPEYYRNGRKKRASGSSRDIKRLSHERHPPKVKD